MADERIEIEIVLDDGSIKKGFARVQKESKKTGKGIQNSIGKSLKGLSTQLLKVGGAFAAVFAGRKILNNFLAFEEALTEITTITNLTAKETAKLSDELTRVAATFGTSAQDQAKSFYQIISAGITDAARANDLLVASNKLAIGGLASTAESIDILTSAVNAFGKENLTGSKAADILFTTVKLGKTRVSELASSLGQILPTAAALKVSFEDTAAAVAALTTRGISTSEAVTQLNAVLTAVLKKQELAAQLGPKVAEAFSLQALQAKGLANFLEDLNDSLGGSEQKLVKLLGRAEGARAILTLAGDGFQSLRRNIDELNNSTGAADEAFKKISKTAGFQFKQAFAEVEAFILRLSNSQGTLVAGIATTLNESVKSIIASLELVGLRTQRFFASTAFFIAKAKQEYFELSQTILTLGGALDNSRIEGLVKRLTTETEQARVTWVGLTEEIAAAENLVTTQQSVLELQNLNAALMGTQQAMVQTAAISTETASQIAETFKTGVVTVISEGVSRIGASLAGNEDAFKDFGKAILGIIGDIAINIGSTLISIGIGIDGLRNSLTSLTGGFAIAAGFALVALGGALKSIGGGGIGVGAPSTGISTAPTAPDSSFEESPSDELEEQRGTITVNVEGTVLDPRGVGLQIAELLKETNDSNGLTDITVNA